MNVERHQRLRHELGVYVLGALEPFERERVEQHLSTCPSCRDEVARLAVLPSLLSRVPDADPPPAAPPFEPVLRRVAMERRGARRRALLVGAAAVVAAVTLTAATTVVLLAPGVRTVAVDAPTVPAGAQRYAAADGIAVARVEPRAWGMAVRIEARQLPPTAGYTAVAVAHDGHRTQVASWSGVDRPITVDGACYLAADELRRLEILSAPDNRLLAVLEPAPG